MKVSMKVEGLAALEQALRQLPDKIAKNALRGAVYSGAKIIRDEARIMAPRYSGRVSKNHPPPGTLKRSIITKHIPEQSGRERQTFFVTVRSGKRYRNQGKKGNLSQDAFYWRWVEFGHRVAPPNSRKNGRLRRASQPTGQSVIYVPARPFMRPAFEARKYRAVETIKTYLLKRIDAEARQVANKK